MKLSENFVEVLKNFASINSGLVVKPGQVLRTISSNKTILAEAHVDEVFESEFGIYDLNKTLALLSLNKGNPEVAIEKESLVYLGLNGRGRTRQRFTDTKLILAPPSKNINVSKYDVEFELTEEIYEWIMNVSSILKCPNIIVQSTEEGGLSLAAIDVKGEIVDDAEVALEGTFTVKSFKAVFKLDNIKIMPGAYKVELASMGVAKFTNKTGKLTYWVSLEAGASSFQK
jgi:hypothetical protein